MPPVPSARPLCTASHMSRASPSRAISPAGSGRAVSPPVFRYARPPIARVAAPPCPRATPCLPCLLTPCVRRLLLLLLLLLSWTPSPRAPSPDGMSAAFAAAGRRVNGTPRPAQTQPHAAITDIIQTSPRPHHEPSAQHPCASVPACHRSAAFVCTACGAGPSPVIRDRKRPPLTLICPVAMPLQPTRHLASAPGMPLHPPTATSPPSSCRVLNLHPLFSLPCPLS